MAQWPRSQLPVQETQVRSLIWDDPTCGTASKPASLCSRGREPRLLKPPHSRDCAPQQEKPLECEALAPQGEKSLCRRKDPSQLKINKIIKLFRRKMWEDLTFHIFIDSNILSIIPFLYLNRPFASTFSNCKQ